MTGAQRVQVIGDEQPSFGGGRQNIQGAIFLLNDFEFTDGILFAYSAYIEQNSSFRFQVWRPVENGSQLDHRLISELAASSTVIGREDVSFKCL